jgi:hypothetical protein
VIEEKIAKLGTEVETLRRIVKGDVAIVQKDSKDAA